MALRRLFLKGVTLLGLSIFSSLVIADEPCLPCGEIITNAPLPTPATCNSVAPFQNFMATYECCPIRAAWGGLYFGGGVGAGTKDYNLNVPGITLQSNGKKLSDLTEKYFLEYAVIGYSHVINRFFIAGELGYYYHSNAKPIYYEDDSSFLLVRDSDLFPVTVEVSPCSVRLDINAHNHVALDLLPGFSFASRLNIFGRVGLEYTQYTWQRRVCFPNVVVEAIELFDIVDPLVLVVDDQEFGDYQTDSVINLRLGAGIAFAVCPHVVLNLNYIHVVGSKATFTPNVSALQANIPLIIADLVDPVAAVVTSDLTTLTAQNRIDTNRNELLFGVTFTF